MWDFGDGSPTVTGSLAEGVTRVDITHSFRDFRPTPYTATLTVDRHERRRTGFPAPALSQCVSPCPEGLLVWGWDVGETARSAVRALAGNRMGGHNGGHLGRHPQPRNSGNNHRGVPHQALWPQAEPWRDLGEAGPSAVARG